MRMRPSVNTTLFNISTPKRFSALLHLSNLPCGVPNSSWLWGVSHPALAFLLPGCARCSSSLMNSTKLHFFFWRQAQFLCISIPFADLFDVFWFLVEHVCDGQWQTDPCATVGSYQGVLCSAPVALRVETEEDNMAPVKQTGKTHISFSRVRI